MTQPRILIVADHAGQRRALAEAVQLAGFDSQMTDGEDAAVDALGGSRWAGVLVAVESVEDPAWRRLARRPGVPPVIVVAERGGVRDAVHALRSGAEDFFVASDDRTGLAGALRNLQPEDRGGSLVVEDPALRQVTDLACRVAAKEVTILLTGESGTGKEVFARYIHQRSPRAAGPFVAVNCAAIPENMLEAVLFGYEKGAFTGAHRSHSGKFEQAQGGTLLLDEISEIDAGLQAKLLRVLQEREVERLCGSDPIPLDVRVLASTNRDLQAMVRDGGFREDLYYRLHVFPLHIPALRERPADVLPLANAFLHRYGSRPQALSLSRAAEQRLLGHDWPGNVRELENVIQRAVILADGPVVDADAIRFSMVSAAPQPAAEEAGGLEAEVKTSEHRVILETLQRVNGSRKAAAQRLGISDRTLRYKLARMRRDGVSVPPRFGAECA